MLRILMVGAVIAVSGMVSGAVGMFMGARSAVDPGGWLDGARATVERTLDGRRTAEEGVEDVRTRLAEERAARLPARERWAAHEGDRWAGRRLDRAERTNGIPNTLNEDDRWSDEPRRRVSRRDTNLDDGRERRLRDDDRRTYDRRPHYEDGRYRLDDEHDRYDDDRYDRYDEPMQARGSRDDRRGDRAEARPEPARERIEVVVRTEPTAPPAAAPPTAAPPAAAAPALAPQSPPTMLASHTGHLPAAIESAVTVPTSDPEPEPEPEPEPIEVTVPAGTVIDVTLSGTISTETARVEDRIDGTVTRSVHIAGRTVIPAGTRVRGTVSNTDDGGRLKGAARLAVRFHELMLDDGTVVEFSSRSFERVGPSPGRTTATRTGGGAAVGTIIGGLLGGERGAAIGGSIGAAGGAASSAGRAKPVTFHTGTSIPVTFTHPARVIVEG